MSHKSTDDVALGRDRVGYLATIAGVHWRRKTLAARQISEKAR